MKITDCTALYINLKKDTVRKARVECYLDKLNIKYYRIDAVYGKQLKDPKYVSKISKKMGIPVGKLIPSYWMDRHNFKTMTSYQDAVLNKVGAYLSHLLAIQTALKKKLTKVLILEDDIEPLKNITKSFSIPKDADIFYLGGTFLKTTSGLSKTTSGLSKTSASLSKKYARKAVVPINRKEVKLLGAFSYIIPSREKMLDIKNVLSSVFLEGKGKDKSIFWRSGKVRLRAQSIDFAYVNLFQQYGNCYVINPVSISHAELGSNIINNRRKYKLNHFLLDTHEKNHKRFF